ncbi:hypothetical protein CLE01_08500 [Cryobacterium levicorallinum]|nr:hypothetical protein CLE01_08500 [Cryobacterium levicorallinum]
MRGVSAIRRRAARAVGARSGVITPDIGGRYGNYRSKHSHRAHSQRMPPLDCTYKIHPPSPHRIRTPAYARAHPHARAHRIRSKKVQRNAHNGPRIRSRTLRR